MFYIYIYLHAALNFLSHPTSCTAPKSRCSCSPSRVHLWFVAAVPQTLDARSKDQDRHVAHDSPDSPFYCHCVCGDELAWRACAPAKCRPNVRVKLVECASDIKLITMLCMLLENIFQTKDIHSQNQPFFCHRQKQPPTPAPTPSSTAPLNRKLDTGELLLGRIRWARLLVLGLRLHILACVHARIMLKRAGRWVDSIHVYIFLYTKCHLWA